MPSTRPQASFEPLPLDLDVNALVETTPNFEWVTRIHCDMIEHRGLEDFEKLLLTHVIRGGIPLVIEGYNEKLDKQIFSTKWLRDNWGTKVVEARDLTSGKNVPLTIQHYLRNMTLLTNQWNSSNYKDDRRQRMYLKDIDCHNTWARQIKNLLPPGVFYLDEADIPDRSSSPGHDLGTFAGKTRGTSGSGDLMSSLPPEMRAENLMCYIGHEGTYTPAHREMCASLGHNLMVEASQDGTEDNKLTKSGSSIWFMTETKYRDVVSEYWLSRLGHDIEVEMHFAQITAWKQAPFKVHVVEQRPGDFIIIPPLAPHQVWNRGTRTMKVAWNRTTVDTLEMALNEALFKARMVCRDEQYKNKAIIFYTMQKYSRLLNNAEDMKVADAVRGLDKLTRKLFRDFKRLHSMYTAVLVAESFLTSTPEPRAELLTFDSNITCSYCRCNIFNRFLTCPACVGELSDGAEDTYDICLDCYAMGRSCRCISGLRWVEQWAWNSLKDQHERWRLQITRMEGKAHAMPSNTLDKALEQIKPRLSVAQICQLELAKRPFHDTKNGSENLKKRTRGTTINAAQSDDEEGNRRKRRKVKPSDKFLRGHARCHVDCYWEPKWKQAECQKCHQHYCYGILFRAYDEMPQDVLANPQWECPSCRNICGCKVCRRKPGYQQYVPKGTLLGHNTRAVADPRSVESLVDFSQANLAWIQKAGDDHMEDTFRLRRRLQQAEAAGTEEALVEDHEMVWDDNHNSWDLTGTRQGEAVIDPRLTTSGSNSTDDSGTLYDDGRIVEHPEVVQSATGYHITDDHGEHVTDGGTVWYSGLDDGTDHEITYAYPATVSLDQLQLTSQNDVNPQPSTAIDVLSSFDDDRVTAQVAQHLAQSISPKTEPPDRVKDLGPTEAPYGLLQEVMDPSATVADRTSHATRNKKSNSGSRTIRPVVRPQKRGLLRSASPRVTENARDPTKQATPRALMIGIGDSAHRSTDATQAKLGNVVSRSPSTPTSKYHPKRLKRNQEPIRLPKHVPRTSTRNGKAASESARSRKAFVDDWGSDSSDD